MASEWNVTTLGAIATKDGHGLVDGPFGSNLPASCYTTEGIPVIRGSNLALGTCRFISENFVFVSNETAARLERSLCRPHDILFTKKGTLGQTGLIPFKGPFQKYLLSSNQMKLSVDARIACPLFVYYCVSSSTSIEKIRQDSESTGVPKTNITYLRGFSIPLPPLSEQRAIACILGALDDKIELNRRQNRTLEAMARAIFQSWFVDFDPVKAKAAGRTPPGLSADVASLFPSAFEESELGEIPHGWRVGTVGNNFRLTMGQSPPGDTYNQTGDGVPFYQGRTDFGFRFPDRRIYCSRPTRFAETGDTLVSVRAPVGDVNIATERCAVGRGVASVRHNRESRSLTFHAMRNLRSHFDKFEAEGTVFGSINKSDFAKLPFLESSDFVLDAFERVVAPIDNAITISELESRTLAGLRDALLPKLISGELRVADAEKIAGRML